MTGECRLDFCRSRVAIGETRVLLSRTAAGNQAYEDCCVFNFLRCTSVDRKHLMRFQSETAVLKFLTGHVIQSKIGVMRGDPTNDILQATPAF